MQSSKWMLIIVKSLPKSRWLLIQENSEHPVVISDVFLWFPIS